MYNFKMPTIHVTINLLLLMIVIVSGCFPSTDNYWTRRNATFRREESLALGGSLILNDNENIANDLLMELKDTEMHEAFLDSASFLPAKNFIEARNNISQSKVFDFIRMMPKGAVLHVHSTALTSDDYIFNNITYRDNLYVCDDGALQLRFFNEPNMTQCNWQLLQNIRRDIMKRDNINSRIRDKISMISADPNSTYDDIWKKFEDVFKFLKPLLMYRSIYEDYFYQGLKELYDDNVLYLELRSTLSPLYDLDGTVYNTMETLQLYKEVSMRFMNDYPDFCGVKVVYSPFRVMSSEKVDKFIDSAIKMQTEFPDIFAGIDLVGQEDKGGLLKTYADKFHPYIDKIQTFFHAGETNWYGTVTDENLFDAINLKSKRIGHGYALVKHPVLLEMIKTNDIAVEICPISNQVLGLVKDLRNHPGNILFAGGFPVVVSNDDPGHWGARGLSYDFYEAFMGMMSSKADLRALKQLAINSIKYSSMTDSEKLHATEVWTNKWTDFIDKFIVNMKMH